VRNKVQKPDRTNHPAKGTPGGILGRRPPTEQGCLIAGIVSIYKVFEICGAKFEAKMIFFE